MALGSIKGAEPSTVTFKLRTVTFDQNSTTMHSEVLVLGDPNTTNAIAAVLNTAPASTAWAIAVRRVGTAAENPVQISGNSTVSPAAGAVWAIQGNSTVAPLAGSLWTIQGNSTVFQGSSAWQVQISNGNSSVTITSVAAGAGRLNIGSTAADNAVLVSGNSTVFQGGGAWAIAGNSTVAPLAGSTWNTRPVQSSAADLQMTATPAAGSTWNVRALQSSAADFQMTATPAAGSTWRTQPGSTLWASSAGFHFDSSGGLQISGTITASASTGPMTISQLLDSSGGSITAGDSANNALRVNVVAGAAGGSTIVTVSTGSIRVGQSSAADLQATVTQASTVWAVQLTQYSTIVAVSSLGGAVIMRSSAADALVTVYQSSASNLLATVTIGTNLQSTTAPSSNSSGLVVRQVVDSLTTFASTSALASTTVEVASSAAGIRHYVTAYTITSTNQTPTHWGFFSSNGTLLWPVTLAALSSATCGANLAVAAPGYLFRTTAADALNFKTTGSTVAGVQLGVSYFRAP